MSSNEEEMDVVEEKGNEVAKFDPKMMLTMPIAARNTGYSYVLKEMITRIELDGTLGKRREYGRKTEGKKMNEERDQEFYYNLDDAFIDDGEIVNNESMNRDFSQQEHLEDDLGRFLLNFEFLPSDKLQKYGENIQARKRKRMEDEQISDERINDKMEQLEKAIHENKDGTINTLIQEIAFKLKGTGETNDNEWLKYKNEICLKLQRIFKEKDKYKIDELLSLFIKKKKSKEKMNNLSDMLFRYIERNTKQFQRF